MIKLSKHKATINFSPNGISGFGVEKKCLLLYAVKCTKCNNIIKASFCVDEPIDVSKYEETRILHTINGKDQGSLFYIYPRKEDPKGSTTYESVILNTNGQLIQTIRMKNHVVNPSHLHSIWESKMEVGERPCLNMAFISVDKVQCLRQVYLNSSYNEIMITSIDFKAHFDIFSNRLNEKDNYYIQNLDQIEIFGSLPVYAYMISTEDYRNSKSSGKYTDTMYYYK